MPSHMKWPPVITRTEIYGEVVDTNGRNIPRDIGRPCYIGGNTYYLFGDTFCHDDRRNFVGGTDNTVAYVPDPRRNPTKCSYLHKNPKVPQFIPHTPSEIAYENAPGNKKANNRIVLWVFGGIIEERPGCGSGWVFHDKLITEGAMPGHMFGEGVCRVDVYDKHWLKVSRLMGDQMMFGPDEPKFGSITHFIDDDGWVYLLGHKDPPHPTLDLKNFWARIRRDADFTDKSNYQYLKKTRGINSNDENDPGKWESSYKSIKELKLILPAMQQGAVIKVPEFAPKGRPYMWFGVNKFGAGLLYIAVAPRIEGPWELWEGPPIPGKEATGGRPTGMRYALYPHQHSCDPGEGQMLCSWSDNGQFGGMVCQALYHFEMTGSPRGDKSNAESEEGGRGRGHGRGRGRGRGRGGRGGGRGRERGGDESLDLDPQTEPEVSPSTLPAQDQSTQPSPQQQDSGLKQMVNRFFKKG